MTNFALFSAIAPVLAIINGIPTTTSADIARYFGKAHADVLRAIRNLLPQLPDGGVRNFAEAPFKDPQNGQTQPAYRLTRDGFTLLAMGFTGKKALQFKLAYIDAFNRMEAELLAARQTPENTTKALAAANEVAQRVQAAVFDACMSSRTNWTKERLLLSFNYRNGEHVPHAQFLEYDAHTMSLDLLAKSMNGADKIEASNSELANLAAACNQRLAQNIRFESERKAIAAK